MNSYYILINNFLVCSSTFLFVLQHSCLFFNFLVCSSTFLFVLQLSCLFFNIRISSSTFVFFLQHSCFFFNILVSSSTFFYSLCSDCFLSLFTEFIIHKVGTSSSCRRPPIASFFAAILREFNYAHSQMLKRSLRVKRLV